MRRAPLVALLLVIAGCRTEVTERTEVEFLLAAGDSTYWVRLSPAGARMRGSPIHLARIDGRFHELYVTDDDRSSREALIVGQRLYRRDIITGDSLLVLDDSTIAAFSRWYGVPGSPEPPRDDDEEEHDPRVIATSELGVLDQHHRYVSYEYAASMAIAGRDQWETSRRGVVDMVTGTPATLEELFGVDEARRARAAAESLFAIAIDSILASRDARAEPVAEVLGELRLQAGGFALTTVSRAPAVEFAVAGSTPRSGGVLIPLEPVPVQEPEWWQEVRPTLPVIESDTTLRWTERGRTVTARPEHGRYRLIVRTPAGRERSVGRVPAPAWRIFWLDAETDSTTLRALARAFDEAAFYDEDVRTAMSEPNDRLADAGRPQRPVSDSRHETSEIMMPQHANNLGHVFGGVILSMMDRASAVAAIRHARRTCVTVSVDRVDFREPIHLGELVVMKASVNFAGRTSVEVGVRVEAENMITGLRRHTNSCYLTFVAVDERGRPVQVPQVVPDTPDEHRRYAAAQERRRRRLEERSAERRG